MGRNNFFTGITLFAKRPRRKIIPLHNFEGPNHVVEKTFWFDSGLIEATFKCSSLEI